MDAVDEQVLECLEFISQAVGLPIDYTQGGGGNTSAKLDDKLMAVKASGFKLKQVNSKEGYVVVNYKDIKDYYENIDLSLERDYEKESTEFVKNSVVEINGLMKKLRPSVEAGFHSLLKKYVIHTHSVYANILCCTKTGRNIAGKIFKDKEFSVAWIPYINPGFSLTIRIKEEIGNYIKERSAFPEVIFMENHGLIVTNDDSEKCVELHEEVNNAIKEYLSIKGTFPAIELFRVDDNTFISKTGFISEYIKNNYSSCSISNNISVDFLNEIVLYPDQLVYLNGSVKVDSMDGKLCINTKNGDRIYKTDFSEAQTIEETLLAYLFVLDGIKKAGFPLKIMTDKEIDFIKNWESEAYRKSLVKGIKK